MSKYGTVKITHIRRPLGYVDPEEEESAQRTLKDTEWENIQKTVLMKFKT